MVAAAPRWRSAVEPSFFDFLGLESLTLKPKNPPHGGFFGFGGERGIRTLDGATNPILP